MIGELTRLRQDGRTPSDVRLTGPESWSPDELGVRHDLLTDLAERVSDIGCPADHAWCGVGLEAILPTEAERFVRRIAELAARLNAIHAEHGALASILEMAPPTRLDDLTPLGKLARRAAEAPRLTANAIDAIEWGVKHREIFALLAVGAEQERRSRSLASVFRQEAWTTEVGPARARLSMLPRDFTAEAFDRIERVTTLVPTLLAEAARLARLARPGASRTLYDIQRTVAIGERVAAAPDASPEAFVAGVWEGGVERAGDLAAAVSTLESARAEIADELTDAAWPMDLAAARATLAAHGTGFFRVFSGEWRRANRLVKSVQTAPDMPLDGRLRLLDALARGQSALKRILDEDDFAKAAFSADWRGDRSASAPLQALVEWMRSLRGLGAEPRLIAGRTPMRSEIGEQSVRVHASARQNSTLAPRELDRYWNQCHECVW